MASTTNLPTDRSVTDSVRLAVGDNDRKSSKLKKRKFRMRLSYAVNSTIMLVVLIFTFLLEFGYIPNNRLGFYCKDPLFSHKFEGDTISVSALLIGCTLIPFIIFTIVEFERDSSLRKSYRLNVWRYYREYLVGLAALLFIVEIAKVLVGEHRPHFFASCKPDAAETCTEGEYVNEYKCTNTQYSNYHILDTSRSFPSGHGAASVYMSLYCMVYIYYRLTATNLGSLFKPFLILVCITWTVFCSLTRITDHRHHWWDVLSGVTGGILYCYYIIATRCNNFQCEKKNPVSRPTGSTTTLLDVKNKDSTSVLV